MTTGLDMPVDRPGLEGDFQDSHSNVTVLRHSLLETPSHRSLNRENAWPGGVGITKKQVVVALIPLLPVPNSFYCFFENPNNGYMADPAHLPKLTGLGIKHSVYFVD